MGVSKCDLKPKVSIFANGRNVSNFCTGADSGEGRFTLLKLNAQGCPYVENSGTQSAFIPTVEVFYPVEIKTSV